MNVPSPSKQVRFHQLLLAARKTWLVDALRETVADLDPAVVSDEMAQFAPKATRALLAQSGIRDEDALAVPCLLRASPTLLGYYRLLLGISQKGFYKKAFGLSLFRNMEVIGLLGKRQEASLPELCTNLNEALGELIAQISPRITPRDIAELPLLTLGSKFYGADNNAIGRQATQEVFLAIAEVVKDHVKERNERHLKLTNAAGRKVTITLAADPDVRIEEQFGHDTRRKVAIEIKGGTDISNAHNRAGEAEKSHQKAKAEGFRDFWTVIAKRGLDMSTVNTESPTTSHWFDASQVLGQTGVDWDEFRSRIADEAGIPLAP